MAGPSQKKGGGKKNGNSGSKALQDETVDKENVASQRIMEFKSEEEVPPVSHINDDDDTSDESDGAEDPDAKGESMPHKVAAPFSAFRLFC